VAGAANCEPMTDLREHVADISIHVLGVGAAVLGGAWLLVDSWPHHAGPGRAALVAYTLAMTGMLAVSAAYHLLPAGSVKEAMRRFDHAMIFAAIAGTYTPLLALRLPTPLSEELCAAMWVAAALGMLLKLAAPRRWERAAFTLYLALGWAGILAITPLWESLRPLAMLLILGGCLIYSLGAAAFSKRAFPFQNALWHAAVLGAAGLQFAAMRVEFTPA
jgi:hemolysin III